ncbi:MAG: ABC transporter permease [Treponema sp.]|nr:ABC transporter permease [Spirochaetales bacterium]MDY4902755.1 ABC transporter permease [Treponema sp.]
MAENKSSKKSVKVWSVIARRELKSYFTSPVAYIVGALFLLFAGFLFFSTFFLSRRDELRYFFELLPMLFSFFIPALTMRVFSEEKKTGTIETLVTLPVTSVDIVLGKYIAAFAFSVMLLVPTLSYVVVCFIFGKPDFGPILGGYLGAVFLAAAFSSIGVFSSAITKNQIIAFFAAFSICAVLTLLSNFAALLPPSIVPFVSYISTSTHFQSISRGIIDSRDIVYFLSVQAIFLVLTVHTVENSKRG